MQALVRVILCCQKSVPEPEEPKHAAHHVKDCSSDSAKEGSELEGAEGEAVVQEVVVAYTPAPLQESALPLEEQKMQEDGGEDSVKVRKSKKRKKVAKGRPRRLSDPGQVPEGKHQPLPPDAKPRRSILKKRP